jgi:hypothetical protein
MPFIAPSRAMAPSHRGHKIISIITVTMDTLTARQHEEQLYAIRRFNEPVIDPIGLAPFTATINE